MVFIWFPTDNPDNINLIDLLSSSSWLEFVLAHFTEYFHKTNLNLLLKMILSLRNHMHTEKFTNHKVIELLNELKFI